MYPCIDASTASVMFHDIFCHIFFHVPVAVPVSHAELPEFPRFYPPWSHACFLILSVWISGALLRGLSELLSVTISRATCSRNGSSTNAKNVFEHVTKQFWPVRTSRWQYNWVSRHMLPMDANALVVRLNRGSAFRKQSLRAACS